MGYPGRKNQQDEDSFKKMELFDKMTTLKDFYIYFNKYFLVNANPNFFLLKKLCSCEQSSDV